MSGFVELASSAAVTTGAGSGIGRASALSLARRGAAIVATDIDGDRAEAIASEISANGGRSVSMRCDVTDPAAFERMRELTLEAFGRVDIVMNNVASSP